MPQILAPNKRVQVEPLEFHAFASFGTVIQNPKHASPLGSIDYNVVSANQGSALKYTDVSHTTNHYDLAPSGVPAKVVMNMFVCSPRQLQRRPVSGTDSTVTDAPDVFPIQILERHPFTPQTFVPTGLAIDDRTTRYLVVVAPTLPVSSAHGTDREPPYPLQAPRNRRSITNLFTRARQSPFTDADDSISASVKLSGPQRPKGIGKPDLNNIKAFIANGSQSVTYGPGTWHAPMVVLGTKSVDIVVLQYANGVALEDCQEIAVRQDTGAVGLTVVIDDTTPSTGDSMERARL